MRCLKKSVMFSIIALIIAMVIAGCSEEGLISGFAVNDGFRDGYVEIHKSRLNNCTYVDSEGERKMCAVIGDYSCDYCEEYLVNKKLNHEK